MIHAEAAIPFTMDDRGVVGFLALLHRGRDRSGESGYWQVLPPQRKEQVRMLAGILRVADGLDGMHRGRVRSLSCTGDAFVSDLHGRFRAGRLPRDRHGKGEGRPF